VYEWNNSAWVRRGLDIDGEAAYDRSGHSVSLSADGSVVAIGAPDNDGNGYNSGHVRVYEWNGSAWVRRGLDIDGEAAHDNSGRSVSLSADGSVVAIGAPYNDGNGTNSGHVRVYEWNGSAWVRRGIDIDGEAAGDQSGYSVSLSADGSVVAIGEIYNDGNGTTNSGHVRVYKYEDGFPDFSVKNISLIKSSDVNNIVLGVSYDSTIPDTDINQIDTINCSLQTRSSQAAAWATIATYALSRDERSWGGFGSLPTPFGGNARVLYTINPISSSSYSAVTYSSDVFAYSQLNCSIAITGLNTITVTPTNPTGTTYAHKIRITKPGPESIPLTASIPGFTYDAAGDLWVVPAPYSASPYTISGISLADSSYEVLVAMQNPSATLSYGYVANLVVPPMLTAIGSTSDIAALSIEDIVAAATNEPTFASTLSNLAKATVASTLTSTVTTVGDKKSDIDASLKRAAVAQSSVAANSTVQAFTIPNADLTHINASGLVSTTAIVAAALPLRNDSTVDCVLTPAQEAVIKAGGQFYIAGSTGESLRFKSQDGLRSVLFEFPGTGQVTIDGTPRSIGDEVVTAMGKIKLNFSGSIGGSGVAGPVCFLADAPVLTPSGYRPIHTLQVGDMVRTAAGRDVAVKRVFTKEYSPSTSANPFVIPKGMFGALRYLPISPNHEVMTPKGMVKAKDLGLPRMKMTGSFTYYNLELEDWVRDNLVVAGVTCESLAPASRITMTKAEFVAFVKARYGPTSAARLRSACFEEVDGRVSMPAL
jgi:hypothetical protein